MNMRSPSHRSNSKASWDGIAERHRAGDFWKALYATTTKNNNTSKIKLTISKQSTKENIKEPTTSQFSNLLTACQKYFMVFRKNGRWYDHIS